jgi:hypothetical protein
MSDKAKKVETSFLHEAQKSGKASGKVEIDNLDEVLDNIASILQPGAVEHYKNTPEEEWGTTQLAIYCHDCRDIVSAGEGRTPRGKPRVVCGTCRSKKITWGREEALRKFYHLEKKGAPKPVKAKTS